MKHDFSGKVLNEFSAAWAKDGSSRDFRGQFLLALPNPTALTSITGQVLADSEGAQIMCVDDLDVDVVSPG